MTTQNRQPIPANVTTAELAELIGVGESRIRQLVSEGVFERSGRNRFEARKALLNYCEFLRDRPDDTGGDDAEFKTHRARLYKARADAAERANALARGTVFSADAVKAVFVPMLMNFRARILAIPTKAAAVVADISAPNECFDILETECREALTELSEYDPAEIFECQRAALGQDALDAPRKRQNDFSDHED